MMRRMNDALRHAAVEARDPRFDGVFYTGVTSTGIYCRCVCPARMPKPQNRRFFASAAAAEREGFRPCLLCRPEAAPGVAPIDRGDRLAGAALAEIEAGALEEEGIEALAERLGVTSRHLRRVTGEALGASPIELAQTHRLLTAKRLLTETDMSATAIAFAAGFQSLRRFNALFRDRYGIAPSRIRARKAAARSAGVRLSLAARGAWSPAASFAFLAARALKGVEVVEGLAYRRVLTIKDATGVIAVESHSRGVHLTIPDELAPHLRAIIARVRRAFDLDCDIDAIDAALGRAGGALAVDVGIRPGVRLVGGLDAFEIVARAILGQQVTQSAGRALAEKVARTFGRPVNFGEGFDRAFPAPRVIADQAPEDIAALGMPLARARTLVGAARAYGEPFAITTLDDIEGLGPWTKAYVRMRALGDPDAVLANDSAVRRALFDAGAEMLAPWRSYATMRAWSAPLKGAAV